MNLSLMNLMYEERPPAPRGRRIRLLIGVVLLIALIGGAVWLVDQVTPAVPSAFYTPPDSMPAEARQPGDVIRSERVTEGVPDFAQVWRVLYRSTGLNGEPVMISGIIAVPNAPHIAPLPVVAFAQGTIGNRPQCGIGHTPTPVAGIPGFETMIREGYVVAVTDYIGRGTPGVHPYLIGRAAGAAVLDAARAARQVLPDAAGDVVIWGRSQGGHSALWAGIMAEEGYAPDLKVIGVAASAPAIDLAMILEHNRETRGGSVVVTYALDAWSAYYDDVRLDDLVRSDYLARFRAIAETCSTKPLAFLLLGDLPTPAQYFSGDVLADPAVVRLLQENTPSGGISAPILIAHGTADALIPIAGSEAEVNRRCLAGENVQLARFPGIGHDAAEESALFVIGWMGDRFAGRPAASGCP